MATGAPELPECRPTPIAFTKISIGRRVVPSSRMTISVELSVSPARKETGAEISVTAPVVDMMAAWA